MCTAMHLYYIPAPLRRSGSAVQMYYKIQPYYLREVIQTYLPMQ